MSTSVLHTANRLKLCHIWQKLTKCRREETVNIRQNKCRMWSLMTTCKNGPPPPFWQTYARVVLIILCKLYLSLPAGLYGHCPLVLAAFCVPVPLLFCEFANGENSEGTTISCEIRRAAEYANNLHVINLLNDCAQHNERMETSQNCSVVDGFAGGLHRHQKVIFYFASFEW